MKNKTIDLNEVATKRIAVAIREVSEEYGVDQEKTKKALQNLLIVKGIVSPKGRESDLLLSVLEKIGITFYDIFKLGDELPQKDILDMEDLRKLIVPIIQDELTRKNYFKNFLKKKNIRNIPLPQTMKDIDKIPRLENLPPEVFEDFIIKIANNLDKVSLNILAVLIPEMLEIMGPPVKIPFPDFVSLKLIGYVTKIVEWEAEFHSLKTELKKDKRIEKEAKRSLIKGAYVLILARDSSYITSSFQRAIDEAIKVESKFLLPSKMNKGERVVSEILKEKKVPYSKIFLTDEGLKEFYIKSDKTFYVLPSNISNLIASKFEWDSFREYENLKGRRREILSMLMDDRWKPINEIKEEITQEMIRNIMDNTAR